MSKAGVCLSLLLAMGDIAPCAGNQPVRQLPLMPDEPVLFVKASDDSPPCGQLLFVPSSVTRIHHPDGNMEYAEGRDFTWEPGSRTIELTPETRIPFKTALELAPGRGRPGTIDGVLHHEGSYFHERQMLVSYDCREQIQDLVPSPSKVLPRTSERLRKGRPLKLVALGDSITLGLNASGCELSRAPRNQPPYVELVARRLQEQYGTQITVKNLSDGGKTARWGIQMTGKLLEEKPDLVILAFGMNDGVPAKKFESIIRQLVENVQRNLPEADIVLVSSMTENPAIAPSDRIVSFRDVLRRIEQSNVILADVTTPWLALLERKPFSDLSGNNINHPNDFGHRLYADVICSLFEPGPARPPSDGAE